jgi:3-hydroxyacyl-[acyl-carrier-protein] dehydratase
VSETSFCVPVDHPATRGHFPGNPMVPGAALLSAALQAIEEATNVPLLPGHIRSAKFFRPVRPGDTVIVEYSQPGAEGCRFSGSVDGKIAVTGHVQCNQEPQGV